MVWRNWLPLIAVICIWSCNDENKIESEIAKIELDVDVDRFDIAVKEASPSDLPALKNIYPFLFSKKIPDSVWVDRINDTLQDELLSEVVNTFGDLSNVESQLTSLFQHLTYYDAGYRVPKVITLTNDVAYRDKTIVTDSIVLIALDNYLGQNHKFYQNIPRYITANMKVENIVSDLAQNYAVKYVDQTKRRTFLDEMIYHGKLLYFKDVMTPFLEDNHKIGYTTEQLKWARANESAIWSFFVERELLYSTDPKLVNRFIIDAPFSKFYLELDNESPGRLGQYIGWQIVKAYARNSGEDVLQLMLKEPEELFMKSKFKPKK